MRISILSIFFTLLTTYSCNQKTQYINYGDDINPSLVFFEKIDNNYDLKNISGEIIDTTGAGDLYAGGFIHGLINNHSIENCGRFGSICL